MIQGLIVPFIKNQKKVVFAQSGHVIFSGCFQWKND